MRPLLSLALPLLCGACVSPVFEEHVDRAFAGPFHQIDARTEGGILRVIGADVDVAVVTHIARFSDHRPLLHAWTEDGVLHLDVQCAPPEPMDCEPALEVLVPRQTDVVFRTLGGALFAEALVADIDAATTTGAVHVRDVVGDVTLVTDGGGASINGLQGALHATTGDGDLVIDILDGSADVVTDAGRVIGTGWTGTAFVATGSGSVALRFDTPPEGARVETRSGAVTLSVPIASYDLDVHSDFGEVVVERIESSSSGASAITVHSGSGDVAVHGY